MPFNLLLVDDSVTIRRVVELTFAGEDVNVVAVGDGREAIARAVQEPPDIILADVGLGEPDGYQVAAFVKGHPALARVPVVLLTGAFQPIDRARAAECGCDGVLAKPFDLQSMVGVVRGLLERPRALPPGASQADAEESAAAGAAPPGGNGGTGPAVGGLGDGPDDHAASLFDWWVRLLEQGPADDRPADARGLPTTGPPVPLAPLDDASLAPPEDLSLDEYFDLVDEILNPPSAGTPGGRLPRFRAREPHSASAPRRGGC